MAKVVTIYVGDEKITLFIDDKGNVTGEDLEHPGVRVEEEEEWLKEET